MRFSFIVAWQQPGNKLKIKPSNIKDKFAENHVKYI